MKALRIQLWRFLLVVFQASALFGTPGASAEQLDFSSSLNPVGSGARAAGMGGAFIGVADEGSLPGLDRADVSRINQSSIETESSG